MDKLDLHTIGFNDFLLEGNGAITMRDETSRFNPLIPPDSTLPQRLAFNYTGASRVPMHWNNSPFLSGSVYGVGDAYSSFGSSPVDTPDDIEEVSAMDARKHIMKRYDTAGDAQKTILKLRKLRDDYIKLSGNIDKEKREITKKIIENSGSHFNIYKAAAYQIGLEPHMVVDEEFTLMLDHYVLVEPNPADETQGQYEFTIYNDDTNRGHLKSLGFNDSEIKRLVDMDITDSVVNGFSKDPVIMNSEIGQLSSKIISNNNDMEHRFDEESERDELFLHEEFGVETPMEVLAFTQMLKVSLHGLEESKKYREQIARLNTTLKAVINVQYKLWMNDKR